MAKVIAITGASSGIGEAIAERLTKAGHHVVLGARGAEKLRRVAGRLGCAHRVTDVTKRDEVDALVALATEQFGRLDVFVSNAGVMPVAPLEALAVDDWMRMIDVNVKGVLHGIAAALPVFLAQGSGHFVHTASTSARKTVPGQAVYSGTKAAVAAISDGLRQELVGRARVTVVYPGMTATEGVEDLIATMNDPQLRAQMTKWRDHLAMPPDAVARAVMYAIEQPEDVNVGEIVVRPSKQA